jgi:stearoyl-CoA desaturase (delta-9 desaturase)
MAIVLFFVGHWWLSLFFQTFYLHRYSAHRMFTMSKFWERFFYLCTYITQGSSFLTPRGYAILHRMHHAFSDTPKDPHSPSNYKGVFAYFHMMSNMWKTYHKLTYREIEPEARFTGGYPEWRSLDRVGQSWAIRIVWGLAYFLFYVKFATSPWMFALVPFHWLMGPIHGGIVNWCGHRYGYRNFKSDDDSRNTLIFDFVTGGELLQNNHHRFAQSPNFAVRWFEIDPAFQVMRVMSWLKIINFGEKRQTARLPEAEPVAQPVAEPSN